MALTARLQFGDNMAGIYSKEYLVADCHLHFKRHHNHFKPDTDARCETIELVVVAPGMEDLNLYEWYINNDTLSGRVVIDLQTMSESDSVMKLVEFDEAYCYSIKEDYQIDSQRRRCLKLSLVAEKITVNEVEFKYLYARQQS